MITLSLHKGEGKHAEKVLLHQLESEESRKKDWDRRLDIKDALAQAYCTKTGGKELAGLVGNESSFGAYGERDRTAEAARAGFSGLRVGQEG